MFEAFSLLVSLVAVAISIATLQENRNMIEASTRPYIVITFDHITTTYQRSGFIIKNYGQTAATITKFEICNELLEVPQKFPSLKKQFSLIENTLFAPGQSTFLPWSVSGFDSFIVDIKVSYSSDSRTYASEFSFDAALISQRFATRSEKKSESSAIIEIAQCMHELIERQL